MSSNIFLQLILKQDGLKVFRQTIPYQNVLEDLNSTAANINKYRPINGFRADKAPLAFVHSTQKRDIRERVKESHISNGFHNIMTGDPTYIHRNCEYKISENGDVILYMVISEKQIDKETYEFIQNHIKEFGEKNNSQEVTG